MQNLVAGVIEDASPESVKSILDVADAGKTSDSHTELNGTTEGEVTDELVLKNDLVAREASEKEGESEPESVELDNSALQEIKGGLIRQGIYLILKWGD